MTNKTILITGGTSGIGLELAKHNVKLGNQVIITGRNQAKLDNLASTLNVTPYLADSANLSHISDLASSLQNDGITLDGVVLNAGIFYPSAFAEVTPENFDQTIAINTKGPLFTLQALLPILANPSSVVFISSIAVHKGFAGGSVYSASKAAFEGSIRALNIELAGQGIRINSVRPGITATEIQAKAGMTKEQETELFDSLSTIPLQRVLNPDDHLSAVQFLLEDGSKALRNAAIDVDGGYCG